jgi:DNA polymerase-1
MKRLFIVDGHSQIFRAYHAIGYLSTSKGIPTQAVLVLSTMLWKLIREEQPDYLAIALDPPGPTFRDQLSAEYKATRSAMPDDLARQLPYVRRLFDALRTPVLEVSGFEADDVLATLVDQALALPELEVVVVSGDKDLLQLVGPRVKVLSVSGRTGEPILYDEAKVRERWGVEPGQIAEVLALMGDTIDNIKGVHGVGEKTAVKLIAQYGSVDKLYENLPLIAGKLRETLAAGRKDALLSRELALLNRKVPVAIDLDTFRRVEPNWAKLRALWMELEFSRLLKELPPAPTASPEPTPMLEGAAAGAWLERVPAGAPLAVDWAGEARTPESRVTGLALFHPDAGPTAVRPDATPATLGAHELIVHDAKPLLEFWLGRGLELPPVHDTAVAAYLINSARASYRLEEVCMEALGDGPPAADPAHPQGVRARFLWRYWEHAAAELHARELWPVYETIERPLIPVLALMERHGIRVDPARLEGFAKELERDLDNLTREIYQLAGEEFTIASPKQLAQILFEKLKLPPLRRTKTGYSTDADVLTELGLRHELPAKILEHRSIAKLKGTYADTLPGLINPRTGRIHTTFNQLVAATGRLSSQDPNLMNIPIRTELGRRIRAAFIPEDGWRFVAADYSQIELRILAHLSEEPALIESFGRGEDIHTRTASEVFHVGAGDVTSLQRTIAKSANYAILYGVSAFGLSQATKIDQKEAKRYIDDYFASHPRVRAYIDRTLAEGRQRGHVGAATCRISRAPIRSPAMPPSAWR